MVTKIQNIIEQFKAQNRPFWVAALFKMDNLIDRWTVVISAPWLTNENKDAFFEEFVNLLKRDLTREELVSISQISMLDKETHLIEELLKRRTGSIIEGERINGNVIHTGTVIESNPDLVWQSTTLFRDNSLGGI